MCLSAVIGLGVEGGDGWAGSYMIYFKTGVSHCEVIAVSASVGANTWLNMFTGWKCDTWCNNLEGGDMMFGGKGDGCIVDLYILTFNCIVVIRALSVT